MKEQVITVGLAEVNGRIVVAGTTSAVSTVTATILAGPEGPEGPQGPQGDPGAKGDPGTGVNIVGSLDDESELPPSADEGDCYLIDGYLWLWDGSSWSNVGQIKGDPGTPIELQKGSTHIQWRYVDELTWTDIIALDDLKGGKGDTGDTGDTGPANTLSIGTVTQGTASATITGTAPSQTLNLTLPKGDKGDQGNPGTNGTNGQDGADGYTPVKGVDYFDGDKGDTGDTGPAATVAIGTVTTVDPSSPATVTNVGTANDAIFDIEIPQGETGANGSGAGDMLAANNLSDVASTDTARSNLSAVKKAASSTDNAIARFDGTTGDVIQDSAVTIADTGELYSDGLIQSGTVMGAPVVAAHEVTEYYEDSGVEIEGVLIKDSLVDGVDITTLPAWIGGKANLGHTHTEADITDLGDYATSTELSTGLGTKANTSHTHPTTDLTATGGSSTSFLRKDNTWATPTNTTYSEISEAEITTGTASTTRAISGRRAQSIVNKARTGLASSSDLTSHTGNTSNPHSVTKSQVGLGNVDNYSAATLKQDFLNSAWPVGSEYTNYTDDTNPATLLDMPWSTWVAASGDRASVVVNLWRRTV